MSSGLLIPALLRYFIIQMRNHAPVTDSRPEAEATAANRHGRHPSVLLLQFHSYWRRELLNVIFLLLAGNMLYAARFSQFWHWSRWPHSAVWFALFIVFKVQIKTVIPAWILLPWKKYELGRFVAGVPTVEGIPYSGINYLQSVPQRRQVRVQPEGFIIPARPEIKKLIESI